MTMNTAPQFTTTDLALAAFITTTQQLALAGVDIRDPRRATFVFTDPERRGPSIQAEFMADAVLVSAGMYHKNLRGLRRLIQDQITRSGQFNSNGRFMKSYGDDSNTL